MYKRQDKVPGKAALSDHPTRSQAASKAEVPKPNQNDESKSGQNFSSAVREMTARPAPAAERRAIPARQRPSLDEAAQAPATMAQPVPASEPQKKSLRIDGYGRLEKSESDASGAAGAELARPPLRREAEHIGVSSRDGPAADSIAPSLSTRPDDATTPEAVSYTHLDVYKRQHPRRVTWVPCSAPASSTSPAARSLNPGRRPDLAGTAGYLPGARR